MSGGGAARKVPSAQGNVFVSKTRPARGGPALRAQEACRAGEKGTLGFPRRVRKSIALQGKKKKSSPPQSSGAAKSARSWEKRSAPGCSEGYSRREGKSVTERGRGGKIFEKRKEKSLTLEVLTSTQVEGGERKKSLPFV